MHEDGIKVVVHAAGVKAESLSREMLRLHRGAPPPTAEKRVMLLGPAFDEVPGWLLELYDSNHPRESKDSVVAS